MGDIKYFSGERAVVVSDMSGFTRITRKCGIQHFASLIFKMRDIMSQVFKSYGAALFETEADNCFALFPRADDALAAALSCYKALDDFNATQTNEDFKIKLGGMGIGYGDNIIQDRRSKKLYGAPVESAFNLGEDVADNGQVIVDARLKKEVEDSDMFDELRFTPVELEGGGSAFLVEGVFTKGTATYKSKPLTYNEKGSEKEIFTYLAHKRFAPNAKTSELDFEIKHRFMKKGVVAMCGFDTEKVVTRYGVEQLIAVRQAYFDLVRASVEHHLGHCVEESLWIFYDKADALAAVLEIRAKIKAHNRQCGKNRAKNSIPINAFGIHSGDLLFVKDTSVHWGDPVNTAAKLAEDSTTEKGEMPVFVTEPIYEAAQKRKSLVKCKYTAIEFVISNVALQAYNVSDPEYELSPLTDKEITRLEELFQVCDTDKSGSISSSEAATLIRAMGMEPSQKDIETLMMTYDVNKNGSLDFQETCVWFQECKAREDDTFADIRAAFAVLDTDGSGYISASEFRDALQSEGEPLNDEEVNQLLLLADVDSDGKISLYELAALMDDW